MKGVLVNSLFAEKDRLEIITRLGSLSPAATPAWGQLTVPRMLCHVADCLEMAFGERPTEPPRARAFTMFPLKHLLLFALPMPRNVRTAPELLATQPSGFDADRDACLALVERFSRAPRAGEGPCHPFFGVLTWPQWAVLQWKHTDHHLRQFGV